MASTKTDIANMAISALGVGKLLSDLDTDTSAEAKAARLYYENARDSLLAWAPWPFAKEQAALSQITTDPNSTWKYSYTYPSASLRFLRIVPASTPNDVTYDQEIPFRIQHGSSTREIWTNEGATACGEYIRSVTETARFPADFTLALSYYHGS